MSRLRALASNDRLSRIVAALLVATTMMAMTSTALAAPPPEIDALHAQGLAAFKRQDYEGARVAFARSYELAPRTATLLNLALAELNSGRPLDAVRHMRIFIAASDAPKDKVEEARTKMLPRAEAQIGRLQVEAPIGARVFVDGADVGMAPLPDPIDVMPGNHEIVVRLGSDSSSMRVPVAAGDVSRVRVALQTAAPSTFVAPRDSSVAPSAPQVAPSIAPPAAEQPSPTVWTPQRITILAFGTGAVVSTGIGIGFDVASKSDGRDADGYRAQVPGTSTCAPKAGQQLPSQCASLADAISSQTTHHNLAVGFYIGGAALAVGAIASWLFWPSQKQDAPRAWLRPVFGATSGVELGGAF